MPEIHKIRRAGGSLYIHIPPYIRRMYGLTPANVTVVALGSSGEIRIKFGTLTPEDLRFVPINPDPAGRATPAA